jgi:hypothetical protein
MRRYVIGLLVVAGACQPARPQSARKRSTLSSEKVAGREKTLTPHPSESVQSRYDLEPGGKPTPLMPHVTIQPMDMMTSIGDSPLVVTIYPRGTTVDDAFIAAVKGRISLTTWPEMTAVPFDVSINNLASPAMLENGAQVMPRVELRIQPKLTLNDRWYVISLDPGNMVEISKVRGHTKMANGTVGSRFRTGSEPALWGVRFAPKGPDEMVVMVDFSERVASTTLSQLTLAQPGNQGASCDLLEPTAAQAADLPTAKSVTFKCRNVAPTDPIVVQFPTGMAARQIGPTRSLSLKRADFRGRVDGQFEWRPSI